MFLQLETPALGAGEESLGGCGRLSPSLLLTPPLQAPPCSPQMTEHPWHLRGQDRSHFQCKFIRKQPPTGAPRGGVETRLSPKALKATHASDTHQNCSVNGKTQHFCWKRPLRWSETISSALPLSHVPKCHIHTPLNPGDPGAFLSILLMAETDKKLEDAAAAQQPNRDPRWALILGDGHGKLGNH